MGNVNSINTNNNENECLICWDKIQHLDLIQCTHCNIKLHAPCEEIYRNSKKYCKCPHCQRIGTLYNYS